METTFHTFNLSLYDEFVDEDGTATLTWMRCQLSNLFSMNADQWIASFRTAQSYTYNNNYLIFDYKLFESVKGVTAEERKKYITDNKMKLLTTLEVVPGHEKFWDATPTLLEQGWYLSINTPIDDELYHLSGYYDENIKDGTNYWSYWNGTRYCITKKVLPTVVTLTDFQ